MAIKGAVKIGVKTKLSNLSELSLSYGYAISAQGSLSALKNNQVFCDLPVYAVNKNLLSDIGRYADRVNVVTDNARVVISRIKRFSDKKNIAPIEHENQKMAHKNIEATL
ncbi:MAG: hypothetical protein A3F12_05990 [Gammaproteobacteria bacterium RIFCSPHIGHO2_12_FULL_38_14]|nr:MAG: hypothetical protein A3F12_05990 [Gammaproteobacteria bacterium RIFCSPHIGHO2_12_FULL_38_14]